MTQHLQEKWSAQAVRYVLAQFTDIHGIAKGKLVPLPHLQEIFSPGAGFAGPSIWGLGLPRNGPRSEFYARGDVATARVLPYQPDSVHMICDGYVEGQPFEGCVRQTLKRAVAALAEKNLRLQVGIEPEFFLFQRDASGKLVLPDAQDHLDKPSYDLKSLQRGAVFDCLRDLEQGLSLFGLDVLQIDHEDAPGQYEVNYRYNEALGAADDFMRFKQTAHSVAEQYGLIFSLMPKPFADRPGSGLHFHLSLTTLEGTEVCSDNKGGLSELGGFALAGLLKHARALCAIHAPTVNSYKRLVAGRSLSGSTWAPTHIGWGSNNRTLPARVTAGRIEWRVPDGSCNVYLSLAAVIHAILDGIAQRQPPPIAIEADVYEWEQAAVNAAALEHLPQTLGEAVQALADNALLTQAIGSLVMAQFIDLKQNEWLEYCRHVSDWELQRYGGCY
jgi:glutamine synthetase